MRGMVTDWNDVMLAARGKAKVEQMVTRTHQYGPVITNVSRRQGILPSFLSFIVIVSQNPKITHDERVLNTIIRTLQPEVE